MDAEQRNRQLGSVFLRVSVPIAPVVVEPRVAEDNQRIVKRRRQLEAELFDPPEISVGIARKIYHVGTSSCYFGK